MWTVQGQTGRSISVQLDGSKGLSGPLAKVGDVKQLTALKSENIDHFRLKS